MKLVNLKVFTMASASNCDTKRELSFETMRRFPPVIDGRINIVAFIDAVTDLISLVEQLGKVFAPVKYDMQGNLDKIKKHYIYNDTSCLLELMLDEVARLGNKAVVVEGILWLNRALLFFEIAFQEIIVCLQANAYDISMKKIITTAYEGSVKPYHSWVTQQIFTLICRLSPTLPQILKILAAENNLKKFQSDLTNFNIQLHLIRCKIDDFYKENNLWNDNRVY